MSRLLEALQRRGCEADHLELQSILAISHRVCWKGGRCVAQQVVGLFDTIDDAHGALQDLRQAGVPADTISFVARDATGEYARHLGADRAPAQNGSHAQGHDAMSTGAVVGGVAGLLVGLVALAVPGIGPAIAIGTFTTFLDAGMIGAVTGGFMGILIGAGISEADAHVYAEGVRRGGALVMVEAATPVDADRVAAIFRQHRLVDIDRRREEYRASGWTGFDPAAQ